MSEGKPKSGTPSIAVGPDDTAALIEYSAALRAYSVALSKVSWAKSADERARARVELRAAQEVVDRAHERCEVAARKA